MEMLPLKDYPVYVTDDYGLRCNKPECDGYFDHPGRRVTLRELILAITDHAGKEHGIILTL